MFVAYDIYFHMHHILSTHKARARASLSVSDVVGGHTFVYGILNKRLFIYFVKEEGSVN